MAAGESKGSLKCSHSWVFSFLAGMEGERVLILQVTSQSQSQLGSIQQEEQHKAEETYFSEKDAKQGHPGQRSSF